MGVLFTLAIGFFIGFLAALGGSSLVILKMLGVVESKAKRRFHRCSKENQEYLELLSREGGDEQFYSQSGKAHMMKRWERKRKRHGDSTATALEDESASSHVPSAPSSVADGMGLDRRDNDNDIDDTHSHGVGRVDSSADYSPLPHVDDLPESLERRDSSWYVEDIYDCDSAAEEGFDEELDTIGPMKMRMHHGDVDDGASAGQTVASDGDGDDDDDDDPTATHSMRGDHASSLIAADSHDGSNTIDATCSSSTMEAAHANIIHDYVSSIQSATPERVDGVPSTPLGGAENGARMGGYHKDWMGRTIPAHERAAVHFPLGLTYSALCEHVAWTTRHRLRTAGAEDPTTSTTTHAMFLHGVCRFQLGGKRERGLRYVALIPPCLYYSQDAVPPHKRSDSSSRAELSAPLPSVKFRAVLLIDCVVRIVTDVRITGAAHHEDGEAATSAREDGTPSAGAIEIRHPNRKLVRSADYLYLMFVHGGPHGDARATTERWERALSSAAEGRHLDGDGSIGYAPDDGLVAMDQRDEMRPRGDAGNVRRVVHHHDGEVDRIHQCGDDDDDERTASGGVGGDVRTIGDGESSLVWHQNAGGSKSVRQKLKGWKSKLSSTGDDGGSDFLVSLSTASVVDRESRRRPAMTGTIWMQRGEEPIVNLRRARRFAVLMGRALHHYSGEKVFSSNRGLVLIGDCRISTPSWKLADGKTLRYPIKVGPRRQGGDLIPGYSHVYVLLKDEHQRTLWRNALAAKARKHSSRPMSSRRVGASNGSKSIRHSAYGVRSSRAMANGVFGDREEEHREGKVADGDEQRSKPRGRRWQSADAKSNASRLENDAMGRSMDSGGPLSSKCTTTSHGSRSSWAPRNGGEIGVEDFIHFPSGGGWPEEGRSFGAGLSNVRPDASWVPLVTQRFFEHYCRSDTKKAKLVEKFTRQLNSKVDAKGMENVIGNIVIDQLDLGTVAPRVVEIRNVQQSVEGEVGMLMDMRYAGRGMMMRGSATIWINWPRTRYAAIPVSMCVTLRSLRGTMYWHCTRFPDKRFSWAFVREPNVELEVDITAGTANFDVTRLPKVREILIWKLKRMLHEKWVLPNRKYFRIPGTRKETVTQEMLALKEVESWYVPTEDEGHSTLPPLPMHHGKFTNGMDHREDELGDSFSPGEDDGDHDKDDHNRDDDDGDDLRHDDEAPMALNKREDGDGAPLEGVDPRDGAPLPLQDASRRKRLKDKLKKWWQEE